MKLHRHLLITLCLLAPVSLFAAAPAPATQPSMDELQKMFDDKQYQPLLQQLNKLLSPKNEGKLSADLDRTKLLMLKGESHLALKVAAQASSAFTDAAKSAKDPKEKAQATAIAYLIKKSPSFTYTQQTGAGAKTNKIDILADRKGAMEALLADDLETMKPKVEAARDNAKTLPQVLNVVKMVEPISALETTLKGDAAESSKLLAGLDQRAAGLMTTALTDMDRQVASIRERANRTQEMQRDGRSYMVKVGITSADVKTLENVEQTAERIGQAADELAPLIHAEGGAFAQVQSGAQELMSRAREVRTENYQSAQQLADQFARPQRGQTYPGGGYGNGGAGGGSNGSTGGGGTGGGAGRPGQLGR
jgi:uncharacterized membrane protein YgcG